MGNVVKENEVVLTKNDSVVSVLVETLRYKLTGEFEIKNHQSTKVNRATHGGGFSLKYVITLGSVNYGVHADDLAEFEHLLEQSKKAAVSYSFRIVNDQGHIKDVSGHGSLEPATGEWAPESVIEALPLASIWLSSVRNTSGQIIDFKVELANQRADILLGIPLSGKRYSDISVEVFPGFSISDVALVAETGQARTQQYVFTRQHKNFSLNLNLTKFQDGVFVTIHDETQSRSYEQQLKHQAVLLAKVIESSPDMIQIVNLTSGKSVYINKMLLEELNYPFQEIKKIETEKRLRELIHTDDVGAYDQFLSQINSAADNDTVEVQMRWRAYHDGWRWYKTRARIFERTADGAPVKVLAFSQDITQQKTAEEEKRKLQTFKEVEKARTAFFSNVSHEFRTPLTLLLAPLQEILAKPTLPPAELAKVQFAYRNSLRLQKLVNNLLDFSRIESGKLDAIFQPTDLSRYTIDLASNFRTLVEHAGLKLNIKCPTLEEPMYINREMYEKILFNLLSNAFKFTFRGKIEVILKENKGNVKLIVRDTGVGIEKANIEKIFDRFSRIEGTKARTYEGSGIGLALVKELVSVHRGSIKVQSEVNKGTAFAITFLKGKEHLPSKSIFEYANQKEDRTLATAYVEDVKGWTVGLEGIEDKRRSRKKYSVAEQPPLILVVDDNADMRAYIRSLLETEYRVTTAPNGRVALEHISPESMPDVILSDIMMPEMDGYELVQKLKEEDETRNIPVILLSARAGEEALIEGLDHGVDDYIIKPFSAKELIARIDARLEMARTQKEIHDILMEQNKLLEQSVIERTSDLEQANSLLHRRNADLESLNAELSTFAFVASHDLREPLRKIRLFTHVLREREAESLSEKGKDFLQKISASAERMNLLIEDVLSYSRPSATVEQYADADLNKILAQVENELSSVIEEQKAVIRHEPLPVLKCNPLQISQLFHNLISNSLKFHESAVAPEIYISAQLVKGESISHRMAEKDQEYLELQITDNGIGFEQKYCEKIFQMFQRLHGKTDYPGTGVGLAICKKILERHRGFILAKSEPGRGSAFCSYFPRTLVSM